MEGSKQRRIVPRRKPLSDRTNTPPSVPLKPHKPNPSSSSFAPTKHNTTAPAATAATATTTTTNLDNSPNPTSPSTPSLRDVVDVDNYEPISIVYSGRRSSNKRKKDKGKAVAVPVSSAPDFQISDACQKNDEFEGLNLPKAKAMTVPRTKKQRTLSSEKDAVRDDGKLQEYIEKQKAYFKEIDEFELQVEVESGDD